MTWKEALLISGVALIGFPLVLPVLALVVDLWVESFLFVMAHV